MSTSETPESDQYESRSESQGIGSHQRTAGASHRHRPPRQQRGQGEKSSWLFLLVTFAIAVTALMVTLLRHPLGAGISSYDLSTPKAALRSMWEIQESMDIRAQIELSRLRSGDHGEEKLKTFEVRRMDEFQGKKILFISYEEDGLKKYECVGFEKDAGTGLWFPSHVSAYSVRGDNKDLATMMETWEKKGEF